MESTIPGGSASLKENQFLSQMFGDVKPTVDDKGVYHWTAQVAPPGGTDPTGAKKLGFIKPEDIPATMKTLMAQGGVTAPSTSLDLPSLLAGMPLEERRGYIRGKIRELLGPERSFEPLDSTVAKQLRQLSYYQV